MMYVFLSPTPSYVVSFLSLYTCVLFICMQSIISVSHKDALQSVSEIQVVKVYLP